MPREKTSADEMFALLLALLLSCAALARGAHDVWAATIVYIAVLALAAGLLLVSAWSSRSRGLRVDFAPHLGVLALIWTLTFLHAVRPGEAYLRWLDWLSCMALFWISLHVLRTRRALEIFLAGMVPVLCVQAAMILYQQCVGSFFREQPAGTLVNSNIAAAFLILWLPPLAARVHATWNSAQPLRYVWRLGLAAAGIALIFVYSTWALVCVGIAAAAAAVRYRDRRNKRHTALLLTIPLLLAAAVGYKFLGTLNLGGYPLEPGENLRRLGWWWSGMRMFFDHPWLGVGLGNFPSAYLAYQAGGQHTLFAHSFPLTLLAESGLAGVLGLSAFLLLWLRRIRCREVLEQRLPYLTGLALFALFGLISLSVEYWVNLAAFWVFLAAAAAPAASALFKPRRTIIIAAVLAAVCAVPYIASPFFASRNCVYAGERLRAGDLDAALSAYAGAAGIDSLSAEARRGQARVLYARFEAAGDTWRLDQAVEHQEAAIQLDRLNGVLWWELSKYLRMQGKRETLHALRNAALLDRRNPEIRRDLEAIQGVQQE
ncbi:MAG: O-antigen ligase family protein [Elusimicrobiota bacterium]